VVGIFLNADLTDGTDEDGSEEIIFQIIFIRPIRQIRVPKKPSRPKPNPPRCTSPRVSKGDMLNVERPALFLVGQFFEHGSNGSDG
jgi:hypothetical protein